MEESAKVNRSRGRPKHPALGPCCICGQSEDVRVILCLDKLCPLPGRGWGCLVCGQPEDGAMAVICGSCSSREGWPEVALVWACKGYPATDGRVPIGELVGTFGHDLTKHMGEW